MKHPAFVAFGFVLCLFALAGAPLTSAASPDPSPTPVPMTHPDLTPMMFLTGTWNCSQMLRGKQRPDTNTTTVGMDGMWLVSEDTAPPFDQYRTTTIKGTGYMTYDSSVKKWVTMGVDTSGGYGMQSSPGWVGNTITWSGTNLDGSSNGDVITKVSDTETTDESTATDPAGKVTKVTIHCTKSSS